MAPQQQKVIGIAGGLGPYAHIDFEQKLMRSAREMLGARNDQDYPEWVLSCVPQTPDRTLGFLGTGEDPVPALRRSLQRLQISGADFIVVACNTAHLYLEQFQNELSIPIVSMVEETADRAREVCSEGAVGILATTGTLQSRLYHTALESRSLEPVSLLDLNGGADLQLKMITEAIYGPLRAGQHAGGGIKAAGKSQESTRLLEKAVRLLIGQVEARAVIAGCTEIPLALTKHEIDGVPIIDPAQVLAEKAIKLAYGLE